MSLDIITTDEALDFHIGYFGFTSMRGYFILHYGEEYFKMYLNIISWSFTHPTYDGCPVNGDEFYNGIGDLEILIDHSDCDGELTSEECQKLIPCLHIDEEKIRKSEGYQNNPEYVERIIKLMYEFKDLISYCADNPDVKLLFG